MESNVLLYFALLSLTWIGLACLFFNNKKKLLRPFHTKSEMNKPQAEGNAYSRLYSRGRSSNKPFSCAAILDRRRIGCRINTLNNKNVLLIGMVELDHQRSVAKTFHIK